MNCCYSSEVLLALCYTIVMLLMLNCLHYPVEAPKCSYSSACNTPAFAPVPAPVPVSVPDPDMLLISSSSYSSSLFAFVLRLVATNSLSCTVQVRKVLTRYGTVRYGRVRYVTGDVFVPYGT